MWNVLYRIPVATDMANVFFNRKKSDHYVKLNW